MRFAFDLKNFFALSPRTLSHTRSVSNSEPRTHIDSSSKVAPYSERPVVVSIHIAANIPLFAIQTVAMFILRTLVLFPILFEWEVGSEGKKLRASFR